ncbi:hypothetical protein [Streptomyces liliifuscus]|uniref:Phage head morphogenesis domain-containing protein n=1 Tax=Streptomyces liliifuscus TaxID=2797636 RepID=A0A7T7RFX7_9ACTN|nr:hypothetical protein [Streptomyces liliifuscus]QQM45193.1 hypothetical protein JEQ17_41180 [Streptomyces liliifuscus]
MPSRDGNVIRLIQGPHTEAVQAIEDETIDAAVGGLDAEFTKASQETVTLWVQLFGSPRANAGDDRLLTRVLAAIREAIDRLFKGLGFRARTALERALKPAAALGVSQGAQVLTLLTGRPAPRRSPHLPWALRRVANSLPGLAEEQRRSALSLLKPALVRRLGLTGALAAIGRARGVVGRLKATLSQTVNEAVNEGIAEQIRQAGARKVWISERDACTACLAYAGLVVDENADFPGGLNWDPGQRGRTDPIATPPRHPHCRCRIAAWDDDWAVPGIPSMPEVLQREARRSVARGWSLPSESNAARIRAARELIRTGPRLPKSVVEFASDAVRAGRFENRTFPATGPGAG